LTHRHRCDQAQPLVTKHQPQPIPTLPLYRSPLRELAAELRSRGDVRLLQRPKPTLSQQNQQLQISKAVQSVLHLQVVDSTGAVNYTYKNYPTLISGLNPVVLYQVHVQSSGVPTAFNKGLKVHPFQTREAGSVFSEKCLQNSRPIPSPFPARKCFTNE